MNKPIKYPISLAGNVFYWEDRQYFEVFEDGRREEMSREVFNARSSQINENGTPFIIIDDKQIELRFQVWREAPRKIDSDRLEFYRDFGIITEEQYNLYLDLKARHQT